MSTAEEPAPSSSSAPAPSGPSSRTVPNKRQPPTSSNPRRPLHEPRIPPTEFRAYTPKKSFKWPNITIPPVRTEQWRLIDSNVWQLCADADAATLRKYDGKSAAIAMAAIAYSQVYPVNDWHPSDVSKILDIGRHLDRTSSLRNKTADNRLVRPHELIASFYIDFTKLTTMVSTSRTRGEFSASSAGQVNPDSAHLVSSFQAAEDAVGTILNYDRQRYVAVWSSNDYFYVFYVWEPDTARASARQRVCETCCLRILTAETFARFVPRLLRPHHPAFHLVAVRILSVQEVSKYPEENPQTYVQRQWSSERSLNDLQLQRIETTAVADESGIARAMRDDGAGDEPATTSRTGLMKHYQDAQLMAPYLLDFQQAYTPLAAPPGAEILRGFNFVEQNVRIPCMNVAAIVMLRPARSFSWTWDTLEEVLALGHQIYEQTRPLVDGPDILATDVRLPIRLGKDVYKTEAEQAVFGELLSGKADVPDLVQALQVFFAVHEAGVLQGPQSVAVWHELGHFYMFDAKERDRCGRKWAASLRNEHAVDGSGNVETVGCCCVTRFTHVNALAAMYTDTVPLKHRHDSFRITRLSVADHRERSDDWFAWRGVAVGRWIVRGQFYQGNIVRFAEDGRNMQATCMAAVAVLFGETQKLAGWTTDTVDEILTLGDELHRLSVEQLRLAEKFVSHRLMPSEIARYWLVKGQQVEFQVEECAVTGTLQSTCRPKSGADEEVPASLLLGLGEFFENSTAGLVTACDATVAVWYKDDFYYVFDSHARDECGRNPNTCRSNLKVGNLGTSCVMRFAVLEDLATAVLANFELKNSLEYNIARLSTRQIVADQSAPLRKYHEFTEHSCILRPFASLHEGNRSLYDMRADKQTLCNLLAAMCLAHISPSESWSKKDLFDILQLGDKMFVAVTVREAAQPQDDFLLKWDHLDAVSVGNNRFAIAGVERREGVLVAPPVTPSASEEEEEEEEGGDEGYEGYEEEEGRHSILKPRSFYPNYPTQEDARIADLRTMLDEWDRSGDRAEGVLESAMFQLAVWKQNQMYFLFDPKASDERAMPTAKRRQKFMRAIAKRNAEKAQEQAMREAELMQQMPYEEQEEEEEEAAADVRQVESGAARRRGMKSVSLRLSGDIEQIQGVSDPVPARFMSREAEPEETYNDDEEHLGDEEDEEEYDDVVSQDLSNESEAPDATCYVMRFSNLDALIAHILTITPQQLHTTEPVTLILPTFVAELMSCPPSTNYHQFAKCNNPPNCSPIWLIRGSMSQNDQIFPAATNRNRQDVANCITALSMASVCEPEDWTLTVLDVILKYGDRLYSKSHQQYQLVDHSDKLNLYQVISPFILANVKFTFAVEFYAAGDLTAERGNALIRSVYDVLNDFLAGGEEDIKDGCLRPRFGVLVTRQYYVAVWAADGSYFMFDAHEIGPDGRRAAVNGVACMFRFTDIATMADVFVGNLDTALEFNSFQLYRIRLSHAKQASDLGRCADGPGGVTRTMAAPKSNSAYSAEEEVDGVAGGTVRTLHGNMSERCRALKWHRNPPSACHAVAALAISRELNAELWTPRTVDQILLLGNELLDGSVQTMLLDDRGSFDPNVDRLRVQQVRKNFQLRCGRVLVHMEMELFRKGIVCPQESGEISLKNGLSRLFSGFSHAVVTTNYGVVALWRECGYFYLFTASSVAPERASSSGGVGPACVRRFETFQRLYAAIMAAIPRTGELGWFEIRRCDFTLTPVAKDQVIVPHCPDECAAPGKLPLKVRPVRDGGRAVVDDDVSETPTKVPKKCKSKKRTACFCAIPGTGNVMILRGSPFTVHEERDRAARRNQSAAITLVALAMSFVENVNGWSSKTLDAVVQSGRQLYADARHLHRSSEIRLHHLPRKIFVGDVPLELAILAATITEADLDAESLFEFFEQHTMAYLVVGGGAVCRTLLRSLNQFYVFDAMPCSGSGQPVAARAEGTEGTAVCVLRFGNFQRMLEHLQSNSGMMMMADGAGGGRCTALLGPIKCARDYQQSLDRGGDEGVV